MPSFIPIGSDSKKPNALLLVNKDAAVEIVLQAPFHIGGDELAIRIGLPSAGKPALQAVLDDPADERPLRPTALIDGGELPVL